MKLMKKQIIFLSFLCISVGIALFFHTNNKQDQNIDLNTYNYSETIKNISPNSKVMVRYTDINKNTFAYSNLIPSTEGNLLIHKDNNKILHTAYYNIDYTIKNPNHSFIDIHLNVNQQNANIKARLKGLPNTSRVSLIQNRITLEHNVPVDWAGSIAFQHPINKQGKICLLISNTHNTEICHFPLKKMEVSS